MTSSKNNFNTDITLYNSQEIGSKFYATTYSMDGGKTYKKLNNTYTCKPGQTIYCKLDVGTNFKMPKNATLSFPYDYTFKEKTVTPTGNHRLIYSFETHKFTIFCMTMMK